MKPNTQMPQNKLIIGYIRVSDDKQVEHGHSLEAQESKIKAQAVVEGFEVSEIITDGGSSGKNLERPGMKRLLDLVHADSIHTIIIAKLDRLTRSVRDLNILLDLLARHDVALISVTDHLDTSSAAGRLVLNIMASVSQWEREAIGERTREVLQHLKAQGKRVGSIPFGLQLAPDGKTLEPNRDEETTIRVAKHLRSTGYSLDETALLLSSEGYFTRAGHRFTKQSLHHILKLNP